MPKPTSPVTLLLALSLIVVAHASLRAGGFLETFDITGRVASPVPGHLIARSIPIRWDGRSLPVRYSMNTSFATIPNPLGAAFLAVGDAQTTLQASLDAWNAIPTSYIAMQIVNTTGKTSNVGFDFVNELTFRTPTAFAAIASSPSVALIEDVVLEAGDLIDGDTDSDVADGITVATDVDGDGDLEFPSGFYKAGTMLDNDVQFNTKTSNGFRFTVADADADIVTRSVDLMAAAVHEFGHSHGLSHTIDNQTSATDGNGTTMYPLIDTGDPAAELSIRSLGADDIAWSSYHYPEGSAASGLAALQAGDIAFTSVYGLIRGELRHGVLDQPIAGGSLAAYKWDDGTFMGAGFSGTTQASFDPVSGGLFLVSPAFNIVDGRYTIPVPRGSYAVGAEALDGSPVAAANIGSITAQIGSLFGQMNFEEEFFNAQWEAKGELRPGQKKSVTVKAGLVTDGTDITTNRNLNINKFGNRNGIGLIGLAPGSYYAVAIPAADFTAAVATAVPAQLSLYALLFDTGVVDASVAPQFATALLTRGTVNANGTATVDLAAPLASTSGFLGQDGDFAPFYLEEGHALATLLEQEIQAGTLSNLFIVLRLPPSPFPGVSALPPLIGLDGGVPNNDSPIFGLSFVSTDGVTFTRTTTFNFRFSLGLVERP